MFATNFISKKTPDIMQSSYWLYWSMLAEIYQSLLTKLSSKLVAKAEQNLAT